MWTTLTWIFVPAFIKMYGFNGVAMAAVLISLTSFVPLYFVRKIVKLSFFVQIIKPILATVGMSLVLLTATSILPTALAKILIGAPLAIASYGLLIYFLMGKEVLSYLSLLKQPRTS
jgi:O-antigen/teichoic acid export membrane protein